MLKWYKMSFKCSPLTGQQYELVNVKPIEVSQRYYELVIDPELKDIFQ